VCPPTMTRIEKRRRYCPTCQWRTTHLEEWREWYGWLLTCLACGDMWADGERLPRPFAPRWREQNIERAKKRWRERAG
jgi:hypothetical protein